MPVLERADDHRVNRVEGDREQHPEDGGEEKAARDLAYGVVVEEAVWGGLIEPPVSECLVSRL